MTKQEIEQLPIEEQAFIFDNHLENENYETIQWFENNYDLAVWKGWL